MCVRDRGREGERGGGNCVEASVLTDMRRSVSSSSDTALRFRLG